MRGLQLSLMQKPSLLKEVCDRFEGSSSSPSSQSPHASSLNLPGSTLVARQPLRDRPCACRKKLVFKLVYSSNVRNLYRNSRWDGKIYATTLTHHSDCPLFTISEITEERGFRLSYCGAWLARAVYASVAITKGAGGFSISPNLAVRPVVPRSSRIFKLFRHSPDNLPKELVKSRDLQSTLEWTICQLVRLFEDKDASPYDVDEDGNTLLHVSSHNTRLLSLAINAKGCFQHACQRFLEMGSELEGNGTESLEHYVLFLNKIRAFGVQMNQANAHGLYASYIQQDHIME